MSIDSHPSHSILQRLQEINITSISSMLYAEYGNNEELC